MTVEDAGFKVTTFEQTVSALCDLCANQATAGKSNLEARGWYLGSREQFLP